jgi:hypothetical protein
MGKARRIGALAAAAALAVVAPPPPARAERLVGSAAFVGTMTYDSSVPWTGCASTDAEVSITAEVVLADSGYRFAGPVVFTGRSTSDWCTSATDGGAWVTTWSVSGTSAEGNVLDCPAMDGRNHIAFAWFVAGTDGACTVDGVAVGSLAFWFNGTASPTGPALDGLRSLTLAGYLTASAS